MAEPIRQRGTLLALAAEGLAAAVAGCATAFANGQRGIERFAPGIVERWRDWFRTQHRARQMASLEQLAGLPASITREEATAAVERMTPTASAEDRQCAVAYLCAVPRIAQRRLVPDPLSGGLTLPVFQSVDDAVVLRDLLPFDVPPVPPNSPLNDTPYQLADIVRSDSAGMTYRASEGETRVAVQFVFDGSRLDPARLDQLVSLGQSGWSNQLVRLISHHRDGKTPFLIFDTIPAADLTALVVHLRHQTGRGPAADEVFGLMKQLAGALADLHQLGLVHGNVAPTSVLVVGDSIKLADLVFPASGESAKDVYDFGLLWYRLLLADWTAMPDPDWKATLGRVQEIPPPQLALLDRCLGEPAQRPPDGPALLTAIEQRPIEQHRQAFAEVSPEEIRAARLKREKLLAELIELRDQWLDWDEEDEKTRPFSFKAFLLATLVGLALAAGVVTAWGFTVIHLAIVLPLALPIGFALERWLHWQRRTHVRQRYAEIAATAEQLADDYRDDVDAWGGASVLLNVQIVHEFVRSLQNEGGPAL